MNTVAELVSDVEARLHSYTGVREQVTSLAVNINAASTTFSVADPDHVSLGLIQIDDEVIEVLGNDGTTVTTAPWGRGALVSTAADHLSGAKVTNDPLFPRASILAALNRVVDKVEGVLYKVTSVDLTPSILTGQATLPASTLRVLNARFLDSQGVSRGRLRSYTLRMDNPDGTKVLSTGITAPNKVRVTYAGKLSYSTSTNDNLTTLGWDGGVGEVLALGAISELVQSEESARLQLQAVSANTNAQTLPAGSATNFAKAMQQQFIQALTLQQNKLLSNHEQQYHWTV